MAYISISLGLVNLFPIPLLDGGHLMFYAFEKFLGRPLSQKTQEGFFRIGMFLLLSLMFFTTFNDLKDLGTDEIKKHINFASNCFKHNKKILAICWGLQVCVTSAGGKVAPGKNGAHIGIASNVQINNEGKIIFGSTVFLENLDTNEKINYKIVCKNEADIKQKLIYFQSPIGKGLIGKNKSDLVEIKTP